MNASLLKVGHEHALPKNDDFRESLLKGTIIQNDAADRMRRLYLLDLFRLGIGVLNLLSQLGDVSPVLID